MPRPRFHKLDPDKQAAILQAATLEFATQGYEGASLNRIIAATGTSKGALYYYFDDKLDLFATVIRDVHERLMASWDLSVDDLDAATFWPRMRDLGHSGIEALRGAPWLAGLERAYLELPEETRKTGEIGALYTAAGQWVEACITRGQELGVVRDDLPAQVLTKLWLAMDEVLDEWALSRWESLTEEEAEKYVHTCLALMKRVLDPPQEDEA